MFGIPHSVLEEDRTFYFPQWSSFARQKQNPHPGCFWLCQIMIVVNYEAMKEKSQSIFTRHPSVILTLDDIELIYAIVNGISENITLSDEKYKYDSLEELRQRKKKRLRELKITTILPTVSFEVSGFIRTVDLYTDGSEQSLIAYYKIKHLLSQRKRPLLGFLSSGFIIGLVFVVPMILYSFPPLSEYELRQYLFWPGVNLGWIIILFRSFNNTGAFSSLRLTREHEQESFWERNREDLLKNILLILLTAILTFVVSYLLFKQGIK